MTRILILVAGAALTLLPGDAPAGCHPVQIQKQAFVGYAPVYGQPYLYSVGQGYQLRAAIEVAKEELRAEMRAMEHSAPESPDNSPERLPITAEVDRWQLVKANCQSCHVTNAKAMEAVDMTSLEDLSCETKLAMIAACLDGTMPKSKKLDPSDLGQLLGEISGAKTVEK